MKTEITQEGEGRKRVGVSNSEWERTCPLRWWADDFIGEEMEVVFVVEGRE